MAGPGPLVVLGRLAGGLVVPAAPPHAWLRVRLAARLSRRGGQMIFVWFVHSGNHGVALRTAMLVGLAIFAALGGDCG